MSTEIAKAIQGFLRSLRERNVSVHTIKAYSGDLKVFAAYVGSRKFGEIDHVTIRGFLSSLYEKGLGKTSVARSMAGARRNCRAKSGRAGFDSEATEKTSASTDGRGNEFSVGRQYARDRFVSRARSNHA